ncbi:hypothetical protein DERP_005394 [Dermatophagoides pteronyssinus]|uniref:Very-long-chain 3-oxoacyl-CoA synthase n=1 Tax=Dermatophagoides pteronyssinus TaxID=6956 RepID=A0ABQ8JMV3_DERPT|nr:hypothetical protein DERP_005394 [Dermatophagoides pteronyssinus]
MLKILYENLIFPMKLVYDFVSSNDIFVDNQMALIHAYVHHWLIIFALNQPISCGCATIVTGRLCIDVNGRLDRKQINIICIAGNIK